MFNIYGLIVHHHIHLIMASESISNLLDHSLQVDLHQQNVHWIQKASRSVWEEAVCELSSFNSGSESEPMRAIYPPFRVSWRSDDWYRKAMAVIMIHLGAQGSAGDIVEITRECDPTNAGIPNRVWVISRFLWRLIWRKVWIMQDSLKVHKQWITLHCDSMHGILSISLLNCTYTINLLLHQSIVCIVTVRNKRKWYVVKK